MNFDLFWTLTVKTTYVKVFGSSILKAHNSYNIHSIFVYIFCGVLPLMNYRQNDCLIFFWIVSCFRLKYTGIHRWTFGFHWHYIWLWCIH